MQLPLRPPIRVSFPFGEKPDFDPAYYAQFGYPGHNGVDLSARMHTPVFAPHSGRLTVGDQGGKGYGLFIWIEGEKYLSVLGHLLAICVLWDESPDVIEGQFIARSGNSGMSTAPHLHWGLRVHGVSNPAYKDWVDPLAYLPNRGAQAGG